MFNRKYRLFVEQCFEKLLKNQENINEVILTKQDDIIQSLLKNQEYINDFLEENKANVCALQDKMMELSNMVDREKSLLNEVQSSVINQMITTEHNLNYYGMIKEIQNASQSFNPELFMLEAGHSEKRILLVGYYGAYNLGDELMLQTILCLIKSQGLNKITVMIVDNKSYDYTLLPGVDFLHCPKNIYDYNYIAQHFDMLIWGGGALIDDNHFTEIGNINLGNMLIRLSERFVAFHKQVMAISLSSNKCLKNPSYIERLTNITKNSCYFSVRDQYSFDLLKKLGVENITLSEDILYANEFWNDHSLREKDVHSNKVIGIVWICLQDTRELFKKVVSSLLEKYHGYKIKCIPFYGYNDNDDKFYNDVIKEMNLADSVYVAEYSNSLSGVSKEIAETDYMINMRYHAMLISGMLNKKMLNICYDQHVHYYNKVSYVLEQFEASESILMYSTMEENSNALLDKEFIRPKKAYELYLKANKNMKELIDKYLEVEK